MRKRVNPGTVGAFVVGGVVLAMAVAILLGSGALFRDTFTLLSFFDGDVTGLGAGDPVRFRGVPVGEVTEVRISLEDDPRPITDARVPVIYELNLTRLRDLVRTGGLDLDDVGALDSLIQLGLRAELQGANLVTGQRAIELETIPGAPDGRMDPGLLPIPEVPSAPNEMAQIQDRVLQAVDNVARADIQGVLARLDRVLSTADALLGSGKVDSVLARADGALVAVSATASELGTLAQELRSTGDRLATGIEGTAESSARALAVLDTTLTTVRQTLEPGAPLVFRIDQALGEVEDAARALRSLAQYLEQNPSALLRGRGGLEDDR